MTLKNELCLEAMTFEFLPQNALTFVGKISFSDLQFLRY